MYIKGSNFSQTAKTKMCLCVDFHARSINFLVFNNMGHGRANASLSVTLMLCRVKNSLYSSCCLEHLQVRASILMKIFECS